MSPNTCLFPPGGSELPEPWRSALAIRLGPDEHPVAWLETDLDAHLQFRVGLVVLTTHHLLSTPAMGEAWERWSLAEVRAMRCGESSGIGTLELLAEERRLAQWRYSLPHERRARHLAEVFLVRQAEYALKPSGGEQASPLDPSENICSACGRPVADERSHCDDYAPIVSRSSLATLKRLAMFARKHTLPLLLGVLLVLAGTLAGLVPPYLTMPLMDRVLVPHQQGQPVDWSLAGWLLLGLAGASALTWLLNWGRTLIVAWVSERIAGDLRSHAYQRLHRLDLDYFGSMRTGDIISRIVTDSDRLCTFLSLYALDSVADVTSFILTAAVMVSIDPRLALVTLLPLPLVIWLLHVVRLRLRQGFERSSHALSELTNVTSDAISGVRVVKAFAQEERESLRFNQANDHLVAVHDRVNRLWSFFDPTVVLITDLGLLVVWACGIWLVARDTVTVGVLTAFIAYISRFYARLDSMSRIASHLERAAAGAQRLFEIIDRLPSVAEPTHPVPVGHLRGEIAFRHVGFRYGTRHVLADIDLSVPAGAMIGLVGLSGAGKTTLVNLLCRFYDVSQGAIEVDGVDIRSYPVTDYRGAIGLVLQDPFLFYGTIAENIAYGRPRASAAEIVAAARNAGAHEFILRLPYAYDSLVGERGQFLSGGERQRISIARALLIDPRILILDEATSSVDVETEREIRTALDFLIRGRTTVVIAHRFSTLLRADHILVLEKGRVSESGRHHQLLARNGTYARLYWGQVWGPEGGEEGPTPEAMASLLQHATREAEEIENDLPEPTPIQPPALTPSACQLSRDGWGRLVLETHDAQRYEGVVAVRTFPITAPGYGIALCSAEGKELLWVEEIDQLPTSWRREIEEALLQREFIPRVRRVRRASWGEQSGWEIETDHGIRQIQPDPTEPLRTISSHRYWLIDRDGMRYLVEDVRTLDRSSRRLVESLNLF